MLIQSVDLPDDAIVYYLLTDEGTSGLPEVGTLLTEEDLEHWIVYTGNIRLTQDQLLSINAILVIAVVSEGSNMKVIANDSRILN